MTRTLANSGVCPLRPLVGAWVVLSAMLPAFADPPGPPPTSAPELKVVVIAPERESVGEFATCIVPLEQDFLVAGYTQNARDRHTDGLLMRVAPSGEVRWRKHCGEAAAANPPAGTTPDQDDFLWHILPLGGGGFLVTGWTGTASGVRGGTDGWLMRIDDAGTILWQRTHGGTGGEWLTQSLQLEDGFISVGQSDSSGAGQLDFFCVRTDRDGNELWSKTWGTTGIDRAFRIAATAEGGFVLAGMTGTGQPHFDARNLRIDAAGKELWKHDLAEKDFDVAHDVHVLPDGSIVVVGYTGQGEGKGTDVFVMKLNSLGTREWLRTFGGPGDDRATHALVNPGGNITIVGYSQSAPGKSFDLALRSIDAAGVQQWVKTWGGAADEMGRDLCGLSDGSIVAVGSTSSHGPQERIVLTAVPSVASSRPEPTPPNA